MPHRLLVGTFHPCGTVTQYTGRDGYDLKKSLIWPRGMATSSASVSSSLVKPYHSHPAAAMPAASSLHKIPDISKAGLGERRPPSISERDSPATGLGAAGPGPDSSCIPALGSKLRRARSSDIDVSSLLRRVAVKSAKNAKGKEERTTSWLNRLASSGLELELELDPEAPPTPTSTLGDPGPAGAQSSASGRPTGPAPSSTTSLEPRRAHEELPQSAGRRQQVCANWNAAPPAREPEPPRSGSSGARMKRQNYKEEDHATSHMHRDRKLKKAAAPVKKIAVRVSMTMSRADSRRNSNAMAMDDVVLLMVPRDALGSRVIALALAARELDWEDDVPAGPVPVVPENPDHFDLLRLRPATTNTAAHAAGSQDRFQIGAGVEKTKPIGDAGTHYFVLCRSRE